jgi:hypothetical protein
VPVTMKTYLTWMPYKKSQSKKGVLFERIQYSNGVWSTGEVLASYRKEGRGQKAVWIPSVYAFSVLEWKFEDNEEKFATPEEAKERILEILKLEPEHFTSPPVTKLPDIGVLDYGWENQPSEEAEVLFFVRSTVESGSHEFLLDDHFCGCIDRERHDVKRFGLWRPSISWGKDDTDERFMESYSLGYFQDLSAAVKTVEDFFYHPVEFKDRSVEDFYEVKPKKHKPYKRFSEAAAILASIFTPDKYPIFEKSKK